ncbi:MAG: septum formation protein [Pirellulaceae bacterium]|jgi:septum formation protein
MSLPPLILASQSPRRRQLLEEWGYQFVVQPPDDAAETGCCSGESAAELVARLALQKAKNIALKTERGLVLGCDTVADCGGEILGKPVDCEHAGRMLRLMRNQVHRVLSGVCLWQRPSNEKIVQVDVTELRMDDLSDQQIEDYLQTDAWIGKAGAFGYQDGLDWVHIVRGSESNVVGLPMERLADMLEKIVSKE